MSLVKQAHHLISQVLQTGDIAIDATVGNGHDTEFLARQVGSTGLVYGFDIQDLALQNTALRLQRAQLTNVQLFHASHSDMAQYIPEPHQNINAVMFNLGYLPKGDKQLITQSDSTLSALNSASQLLATHGIISVLAYTGHQGGLKETQSVVEWLKQLPNAQFHIEQHLSKLPSAVAPQLFIIKKLTTLDPSLHQQTD